MSPFAIYLRNLRVHRRMRQKDLAETLGYEQSYVSAIELGAKGPPNREFVDRIIAKLGIADDERLELETAYERSSRTLRLPTTASADLYGMFYELGRHLDDLDPVQIQLIKLALRVRGHSACSTP
jgi:transcriptional regulator with XRE-family HTH domain